MAKRKKQNEEESQENINNEADDTFGLPEIEYEPLKREESVPEAEVEQPVATQPEQEEEVAPEIEERYQEEEVAEEQAYRSPYAEEEKSSSVPMILGIVVVLLLAGAAGWYFLSYKPKQEAAEKARLEQLARDEQARKDAEAKAALERQQEEDRRRKADSLANATPAVGVIEALSGRTGQYYIVVASAIDDDLIMDHAKVLSEKGVSCKIIPPFGKTKFSRLAVDSKDTYADAQSTADAMKGGDYGNDIWVVKY